jgi:hypothetical protein
MSKNPTKVLLKRLEKLEKPGKTSVFTAPKVAYHQLETAIVNYHNALPDFMQNGSPTLVNQYRVLISQNAAITDVLADYCQWIDGKRDEPNRTFVQLVALHALDTEIQAEFMGIVTYVGQQVSFLQSYDSKSLSTLFHAIQSIAAYAQNRYAELNGLELSAVTSEVAVRWVMGE